MVACNGDPNPIVDASPNVASVKAGDSIDLYWAQTLTTVSYHQILEPRHSTIVLPRLCLSGKVVLGKFES